MFKKEVPILRHGINEIDEEAPVSPIGNEPEVASEENEPLFVSASGSNDNPSITSPTTLLQVNNLIQNMRSNVEDIVAQLRLDIQDIVKEDTTTDIQVEQGRPDGPPLTSDGNDTTSNSTSALTRTSSAITSRSALNIENDGEQRVSLPNDTFSLMIVSKIRTSPWLIGLGIYSLQMVLLVFLCLEMFVFGGNFLAQFPLKVDPLVSSAQFFVLLAIFFLQSDLVEAVVNLFVLSDDNLRDLISESDDSIQNIRAYFVFTNLLKLTMAIITIVVSVALTVRSSTTFDLLKDFAALMIISQLDNVVFTFIAKNGYCGLESKKKADEITTRSVIVDIATPRRKCRIDVLIITFIYGVAVSSWIVILVLQVNGTIARKKGCDVKDYSFLADGKCDGGDYNTELCEWDGGDCEKFQKKYPDCKVDVPSQIGDGICHVGDYDTELCGWDGGDCIVLEDYPGCRVNDPSWIGNGTCNGGDYNTELCEWDGGDCKEFQKKYPDCKVDVPSQIGDGICHVGDYDTKLCGWDGGDCIVFEDYPGCRVEHRSWIGDGHCHAALNIDKSSPYNTEECGYDGGDCLQ
jgi:hypothetical protein